MKKSLFLAPVFLVLFAASPSRADDCVFYQDGNRGGLAWGAYAYESANLGGIWWNDRISSVWVRPGYRARLYRDGYFSGSTATFDGTIGGTPTPDGGRYFNLGATWNDAASAFVCESVHAAPNPACTIYQNSDGSGASWTVPEGIIVYHTGSAWNDITSDVYIEDGYEMVAYADINLTGASTTFQGCTYSGDQRLCPYYDLHAMGWGDRISSFICQRE